MNVAVKRRLLIVWLVLSALTVLFVGMDRWVDQNGTLRSSTVLTVGVVVIALLKVRIIFREFMEVRHAPVSLRRLTDGWVVLFGVCLLGTYFTGMAIAG